MPLELPRLPYDRAALQPHLSAETLDLHHGRHFRAYLEAVNTRIEGTELAELPLEEIVRQTQGSLFDAAARPGTTSSISNACTRAPVAIRRVGWANW